MQNKRKKKRKQLLRSYKLLPSWQPVRKKQLLQSNTTFLDSLYVDNFDKANLLLWQAAAVKNSF